MQLGLGNLTSTSNSPVAPRRLSCQISANQHEAEMSANVNKHSKTRAKDNDVITNVSSKFQRRSCKLSFLFPPRRQSAPESLLAGYSENEKSCYLAGFTLVSASLKYSRILVSRNSNFVEFANTNFLFPVKDCNFLELHLSPRGRKIAIRVYFLVTLPKKLFTGLASLQ